jgi:hypothetical protein
MFIHQGGKRLVIASLRALDEGGFMIHAGFPSKG